VKSFSKVFVAIVIAIGMAIQAPAGTISLSPLTGSCAVPGTPCLVLSGAGSQNAVNEAISAELGITEAAFIHLLLYKSTQQGGAEGAAWEPYYSTSYVGSPAACARVSRTSAPSPFIVLDPVYVFI
jgi:hypothetical protein